MEELNASCRFCPSSQSMGQARYTCPRCNARYCSAACYKSPTHSECSESFYRDCFMDGLRNMETDSSERHRIVDMLRRLESDAAEPDDMDGAAEDLADRITGVDLDGCPERVWQKLTESERQEFERFVESGHAASFISLWTPWWNDERPVVEEISEASTRQSNIPAVLSDIIDIRSCSKSSVSVLIPFNIINILYGYVYAVRLYNGDHIELAADSARVVLDISDSVERGVFTDVNTAISGCISRLGSEAHAHFISREFSVAVITDLLKIISGPADYVAAALSDCCRLFKSARKEVGHRSSASSVATDNKTTKRSYFLAEKKLQFLVSWVVSYSAVLETLVSSIELEYCELSTELASYQVDYSRVEQAIDELRPQPTTQPLITELSTDL